MTRCPHRHKPTGVYPAAPDLGQRVAEPTEDLTPKEKGILRTRLSAAIAAAADAADAADAESEQTP